MLILDDDQRKKAGIKSLSKRCSYCGFALRAYPLILAGDATFAVYHAACAAANASEILVDLYTALSPQASSKPLLVLDQGALADSRTQEDLCSQQI